MIKINKDIKHEYKKGKIKDLFSEVDKVLEKRQVINERYLRGISSSDTSSGSGVQIFFEKFITDLAAGYLSGEITYNAEIVDESEEPAYRLLHPSDANQNQILNPDTAAQLKYIITALSSKNDDKKVLKSLFHDAVLYGAAYERQLQIQSNTDPDYTYYPLSALNTVALFPTDISDAQRQNAVALITVYTMNARNSDDNQEHTLYYCIECNPYTKTYQTSVYDKTTNEENHQHQTVITLKKETPTTHNIPTFSVFEPDPQISIIDPIISLVQNYEEIMNNINNLYHYNDTDAKLKISGYRPENPLTIPNPDFDPQKPISQSNTDQILNPARQIEDEYLMNSKTFFVQEGGDVSWLLKEVHAEDATKYLKYYVDSIFQISGIPNTSDAAFNSGDMNASAIDRKFYTMALMLDDIKQGVTTLIKHRWANFFQRINLISPTKYNIDDISISIGTNLPSMTDENINQQLALNGILSQKTLLSNLGYDYATEKKNKEEEIILVAPAPAPAPATAPATATAYVSPSPTLPTKTKTSTATTTASQTNNQIEAKVDNRPSLIPDRTNNIKKTQTREGRPNK